jgi:hypothetical protein
MSQPNNLGMHELSGIATFGELDAITQSDVVAETWPARGFPRNTLGRCRKRRYVKNRN